MIRKIVYDGDLTELKKEQGFLDIIDELEEDEKDYMVGIDYSRLHSKDKSIVIGYSFNKDGSITIEKIREFYANRDVNATIISKRQ